MLYKNWIINGLLAFSLAGSVYADNLDSIVTAKVVNGNPIQQINLLQHHDSHVFVFSIGIPDGENAIPTRRKYVIDIDPDENNDDSINIDGLPYEKRYLFRVGSNIYLLTRSQYISICKYIKEQKKNVTHKLVQQKLSKEPDFLIDAPEHDFKPQLVITLEHNGELFDQYHSPVLPNSKTIALLQLTFHPDGTSLSFPNLATRKVVRTRNGYTSESGSIDRNNIPRIDRGAVNLLRAISDITGRSAYSVNGRIRLR
jgi:hypothetical protein